jgi:energy-coupling factor transporter ATP-binding protein EcfA2
MKALTSEQLQILMAFKQKIVRHPKLQTVLEELQTRVLNPAGQPLVATIGPTGAGKTTLLNQVTRGLLELHAEQMKTDPGFLPYISVEARSPERGNFDWKWFYEDILKAGNEIHYKDKRLPDDVIPAEIQKQRLSGCSTAALRVAVENMLHHRGTPPLLIDEGQHFLKMASGRKLLDQMDSLKSLSNKTGVKIILFGNYDLLSLGQLSDQLARRGHEIHFGRYRLDSASDVQVFQNIIATFQRALPITVSLDLLQHWKYIYRGSLGCIGSLKDWLAASLTEAMSCGRTEIILKDLQRTVRPEAALTKMARELRNGEEKWAERTATNEEVDRLLGFEPLTQQNAPSLVSNKSFPHRRRVGERNPTRDVVGLAPVFP